MIVVGDVLPLEYCQCWSVNGQLIRNSCDGVAG